MNTTSLRPLFSLAIAASLAFACKERAVPPDRIAEGAGHPSFEGRPCRGDGFFAEMYDHTAPPSWTNGFLDTPNGGLIGAMTALADAPGHPWFCGPDQIYCPMGEVMVTIAPLFDELPSPPYPAFRADAHLRFYRMHFLERGGEKYLPVRPSALCEVVARFRTEVVARTGRSDLSIGRECDASAMAGIDGQPSEQMKRWHLERLGLEPDQVKLRTPDPAEERVDVALIDSGVVPGLADGLGVEPAEDFVGTSDYHKHGTGMGILIRELAPTAHISDYRVLGGDGSASSAVLARAIDRALFSNDMLDVDTPLIINLSLGWPPQLAGDAGITGTACASYEGALGESVRYALRNARLLDQGADPDVRRDVLVVAAAGNQPTAVDPSLFPAAPSGTPVMPNCASQPALTMTPWFFPAQWNRLQSCDAQSASFDALGVTVLDDRDAPSAVSIPDSEAPLVAPGQHVYVAMDTPSPTSPDPICNYLPYPAPVTLPAVFTGSSVGSALVAAAAARVQSTRAARGERTFGWDGLTRLLYLTGDSLCDDTMKPRWTTTAEGSLRVRRLDIARLDRALDDCPGLIDCAMHGNTLVDAIDDCRFELAACRLEAVDPNTGTADVHCVAAGQAVSWPAGYVEPLCPVNGSFHELHGVADASSCLAQSGGCYGGAPDRALLGSLGPQPGDKGCLDCLSIVSYGSAAATLKLQLNPALAPVATFTKKFVQYYGPDCSKPNCPYSTSTTSLDNPQNDPRWTPGASLELTVAAPSGFDWLKTQVTLITTITTGIGTQNQSQPAIDYSPLRVQIN